MSRGELSAELAPPRRAWWRPAEGGPVGLLAAAAVALGAWWLLPTALGGRPPAAAVLVAAVAVLGALLAVLPAVAGVRTVALQTLRQCLRMKVAAVFIGLLAVSLAALPLVTSGDGTLAGRIRTLLSWGTAITAVELALVTVLLSVSVVASDVRQRQVFVTATKPLPRWQYLLGRWLGVVALDAVLLGIAAAAIYGTAQYLRDDDALNVPDRRAVETEVFAARDSRPPLQRDLTERIRRRVARLKAQGLYAEAVEDYLPRAGGDREAAEQMLLKDIRFQAEQAGQGRPFRGVFDWRFRDVAVDRRPVRRTGTVAAADVRDLGRMRIEADRAFVAHLLPEAPIEVNGLDARVVATGRRWVVVAFRPRDRSRRSLLELDAGRQVRLVAEPTIQIAFKVQHADPMPDDKTFRAWWLVANPSTDPNAPNSGYQYALSRSDAIRVKSVFPAPARAVSRDGRLRVQCVNLTHTVQADPNGDRRRGVWVKIDPEKVAVLYRVGAFEPNYLRGALMMLVPLAFLAAMGVFAASFLSFPVACLVCFGLLPFALMRGFLTEALRLPAAGQPADWPQVFVFVGHYALAAASLLIPDFAGASPGGSLVGGMVIPWRRVGDVAVQGVAVRSVVFLALGCAIFRRRELARVQV
jgi:hypothetical protein